MWPSVEQGTALIQHTPQLNTQRFLSITRKTHVYIDQDKFYCWASDSFPLSTFRGMTAEGRWFPNTEWALFQEIYIRVCMYIYLTIYLNAKYNMPVLKTNEALQGSSTSPELA